MTKFAFGIATAAAIGLASIVAPASATTIAADKAAAAQITDFSSQHRGHRADRGHRFHRGPVCTVRTVVKRGPHGRRIVNKVRVCR